MEALSNFSDLLMSSDAEKNNRVAQSVKQPLPNPYNIKWPSNYKVSTFGGVLVSGPEAQIRFNLTWEEMYTYKLPCQMLRKVCGGRGEYVKVAVVDCEVLATFLGKPQPLTLSGIDQLVDGARKRGLEPAVGDGSDFKKPKLEDFEAGGAVDGGNEEVEEVWAIKQTFTKEDAKECQGDGCPNKAVALW